MVLEEAWQEVCVFGVFPGLAWGGLGHGRSPNLVKLRPHGLAVVNAQAQQEAYIHRVGLHQEEGAELMDSLGGKGGGVGGAGPSGCGKTKDCLGGLQGGAGAWVRTKDTQCFFCLISNYFYYHILFFL